MQFHYLWLMNWLIAIWRRYQGDLIPKIIKMIEGQGQV